MDPSTPPVVSLSQREAGTKTGHEAPRQASPSSLRGDPPPDSWPQQQADSRFLPLVPRLWCSSRAGTGTGQAGAACTQSWSYQCLDGQRAPHRASAARRSRAGHARARECVPRPGDARTALRDSPGHSRVPWVLGVVLLAPGFVSRFRWQRSKGPGVVACRQGGWPELVAGGPARGTGPPGPGGCLALRPQAGSVCDAQGARQRRPSWGTS